MSPNLTILRVEHITGRPRRSAPIGVGACRSELDADRAVCPGNYSQLFYQGIEKILLESIPRKTNKQNHM